MGRDSVVGMAIRYGLNGRGSNPRGSEIFRTRPDWSGRGVNHQPPSAASITHTWDVHFKVQTRICKTTARLIQAISEHKNL